MQVTVEITSQTGVGADTTETASGTDNPFVTVESPFSNLTTETSSDSTDPFSSLELKDDPFSNVDIDFSAQENTGKREAEVVGEESEKNAYKKHPKYQEILQNNQKFQEVIEQVRLLVGKEIEGPMDMEIAMGIIE